MATKQTWDTSRTGGGTYEFSQDAQGNYTLGSVGFAKLNKLNLPELKAEATTTAATKDTAAASAQTAKAFGDVRPFYYDQKGEGGTGTQYTMRKEGDLSTDIQPMTTGDSTLPPQLGGPSTLEQAKQFTGGSIKKGITLKKDSVAQSNLDKEALDTDLEGINMTEVSRKQPTQNRFPGMTGPQKPSPYQDAIMRGQTGVKYEKPEIQQVVSTKLRNVKTSLKTLANTVGIALNPAIGIGKMLLGTVQDTAMQKHDRQYFNADSQTGRISGNPATDLYAGINRTSAFGDVGKAGDRRLATREKTIAKKGYTKNNDPTGFYAKTQKMKGDAIAHKKSQTSVMKNVPPSQRGGGGGDPGGGKSIICTQMYQHTHLEDWKKTMQLWYIFQKKYLTIEHQKGYHFLFKPFVSGMKKSKILTAIGKHCAIARTNDIKHIMFGTPFSLLGRLVRLITEPICYITGKIKLWQ